MRRRRRRRSPAARQTSQSGGRAAEQRRRANPLVAAHVGANPGRTGPRWAPTGAISRLAAALLLSMLLLAFVALLGAAQQRASNSTPRLGLHYYNLARRRRLAPLSLQPEGAPHEPLAQTRQALFRGRLLEFPRSDGSQVSFQVAAFLGIRYAAAPVRRLRFMPPSVFKYAANQLHEAQQFGPICRQRWPGGVAAGGPSAALGSSERHARLSALWRRLARLNQSEDCLNLNVYTPSAALARGRGPLPVLVIIHPSDSFEVGAGSALDGAQIARQGKLVAVTFNYRLNILGFPPKVAGVSRGNLGLMDQVAALHWVRDNIAAFGGAPDRVTLLGAREGAIFVHLLMLSPLAKGLFERAVLEDGSALSPPVANRPSSAGAAAAAAAAAGLQQLRLLAKLCDCPALAPKNATNQPAADSAQPDVAARVATPSSSSASDETKTNALMFECLRQKPIEQIMQPIALDLLQPAAAGAGPRLALSPRWRPQVRRLLQQQQQQQQIMADSSPQAPISRAAAANGEQLAPLPAAEANLDELDAGQLSRLLELLERELAAPAARSNASAYAEHAHLLGAFFGPPAGSMRPSLGPLLDGTVVPEEEPAGAMLRWAAPFGQRDLMVGVTRPVLATVALGGQASAGAEPAGGAESDAQPAPRFDYLIMGTRPDAQQMESDGLSGEQAVELVNGFVRSFYRYHQQEIANSIINHYLGNGAAGEQSKQRRRRPPAFRARKLAPSGGAETSRTEFGGGGAEQSAESGSGFRSKLEEQQLLVLDSVLGLFQDTLVSVPLLKTALIHALKQLEPLVEAFVGQQLDRRRQQQLRPLEPPADQAAATPPAAADEKQRLLLDSFASFARSLFKHSSWPLELREQRPSHASSTRHALQPKSTYLYQLEPRLPLALLEGAVWRLQAESTDGASSANAKRHLRDALVGLLIRLQSSDYLVERLTLTCALETPPDAEEASEQSGLMRAFADWLCAEQLTPILANFVASGNVNSVPPEVAQLEPEPVQAERARASLEARLAGYERHCSALPGGQQVSGGESLTEGEQEKTLSGAPTPMDCAQELDNLALAYLHLVHLEAATSGGLKAAERWPVFDLFSQQVATLPVSGSDKAWLVSEIFASSSLKNGAAHEAESSAEKGREKANNNNKLLERGLFWSNFVPALNCTRTQPLLPAGAKLGGGGAALLLGARHQGALNGSNLAALLGLNLQSNCAPNHQTAPKSTLDFVETLAGQVNEQLELAWQQHLAAQAQAQAQPISGPVQERAHSHHKLRMANISAAGQQQPAPEEQQQAAGHEQSAQNATAAPSPARGLLRWAELRLARYAGLLLCAALIGLTLASGACALARHSQQLKQPKRASGEQGKAETGAPPGGFQAQQNGDERLQTAEPDEEADFEQQQPPVGLGEQFYLDKSAISEANLYPLYSAQQQQQQQQQQQRQVSVDWDDPNVQVNNSVTETNSGSLYSGAHSAAGQQLLEGGVVGGGQPEIRLCRSHSAALRSSELGAQEPILMPILAAGNAPRLSSRLTSASANSSANESFGFYPASSSCETQTTISSKKRVKISDPLTSGGATLGRRAEQQPQLTSFQFCPVHRTLSNRSIAGLSSSQQLYLDQAAAYQLIQAPAAGQQSLTLERGLRASATPLWNGDPLGAMPSEEQEPETAESNLNSYFVPQQFYHAHQLQQPQLSLDEFAADQQTAAGDTRRRQLRANQR